MAKVGKLSKLKSTLKSSIRKLGHSNSNASRSDESSTAVDPLDDQSILALGLQTVYVGKSRRAYQISSEVINHPSFQGLIIRSPESDGCDLDNTITIACEVVLFEHLLWMWMLESVDPQTESLYDLVDLYA